MLARLAVSALALAVFATIAPAQDKEPKPKKAAVSVWEREAEGIKLTFKVSKGKLVITADADGNGAILTCETTTTKDGVLKATVTKAMQKGDFPETPPKGFKFSFKWKVDGDKAVLSDLNGEGLEQAAAVIEGEYKRVKPKKD